MWIKHSFPVATVALQFQLNIEEQHFVNDLIKAPNRISVVNERHPATGCGATPGNTMLLSTGHEVHICSDVQGVCVRSICLKRQKKYFPFIRALLYTYPNKPV